MEIDWQSALSTGLTVSVIGYLTNRAVYSQKKGNLKYGMPLKILGIICFLVTIVPLYVLLTKNYQVDKPGETTALIGLAVAFGLGAIYFIIESFFVFGNYDCNKIEFFSPWSGTKIQEFKNLESCGLNPFCGYYALKFKDGTKIRLSTYLGGHGHLIEHLDKLGDEF
jgi:hypothetical protein